MARKRRGEEGHGFLELVWIKSHMTHETAINEGFGHFWWIGNSYADTLADQAAQECSPSDTYVQNLKDQTRSIKLILQHHVEVAVHLAPIGTKAASIKQVDRPQISKLERVRGLARQSGHQLAADNTCVKCGMLVPVCRNMAFLECVLSLQCMGSVGARFPSYQLFPSDGSDSQYMLGRTKVHATHVMATHYHLKVHFCTFCGSYGAKRSKNLQRPCPAIPTKAGLDAIRLISLGRKPDCYKALHEDRYGRQGKQHTKPPIRLTKPMRPYN